MMQERLKNIIRGLKDLRSNGVEFQFRCGMIRTTNMTTQYGQLCCPLAALYNMDNGSAVDMYTPIAIAADGLGGGQVYSKSNISELRDLLFEACGIQ